MNGVEQSIIDEGKRAYSMGIPSVENPYMQSPQASKLWRMGWELAEETKLTQ